MMQAMMTAPKPRHRPSTWKPSKSDDFKLKKNKTTHLSIGQALTLAALFAALAAVVTALIAVEIFSNSLPNIYTDQLLATAARSVISNTTLLHPAESHVVNVYNEGVHETVERVDETDDGVDDDETDEGVEETDEEVDEIVMDSSTAEAPSLEVLPRNPNEAYIVMPNAMSDRGLQDNGTAPNIAWLMSFPNSGTSFTLHMTREATNCTTATNYALEGEIKDKPSVQAIPGPDGKFGPFLELIPDRFTTVPEVILTKTHCKGFCSGRSCGPHKTVHTVRSFMTGCLTGSRAIETDDGLEKIHVTYKPERVKKAIHIFRHPLDNIVARFHLEFAVQGSRGNTDFTKFFPRNATGFQRWCALEDLNKDLLASRFVDSTLRDKMRESMCFNEFYRYAQWHNLAFSVSQDMAIPTMLLHYHDYSDDFESTRDRILEFLELTRVDEGIEFHSGKEYRHYYTSDQKGSIYALLKELSSADTWGQIKDYDFEY